jgi:murein DD-endopeptidase MepM/ murein hydrolase activator NlpD
VRFPVTPWRRVGFGFGDPWFDTGKKHTGWDVEAHAGQSVPAIADGRVYNHTHDPKWGYGVVIDHGGWGVTYWHVDHFLPDGSPVKEGAQVATVFDLGRNTHLHVGVWVGAYDERLRTGALPPAQWPDRFVNPNDFILAHLGQTPASAVHRIAAAVMGALA